MRRVAGRAAVARLERYIEELKQADTPPVIVILMDERIGKRMTTGCSAHREGCPELPCKNCGPCHVAAAVNRKTVFIVHDVPRQGEISTDSDIAPVFQKTHVGVTRKN